MFLKKTHGLKSIKNYEVWGGGSKYLTDKHPRSIHKTMPLSYVPLLPLNIFIEILRQGSIYLNDICGLGFYLHKWIFLRGKKGLLSVIKPPA